MSARMSIATGRPHCALCIKGLTSSCTDRIGLNTRWSDWKICINITVACMCFYLKTLSRRIWMGLLRGYWFWPTAPRYQFLPASVDIALAGTQCYVPSAIFTSSFPDVTSFRPNYGSLNDTAWPYVTSAVGDVRFWNFVRCQ